MITISGKYASADVYVAGFDTLDSASYGQIVQLLSVPCMKGTKIAIMPDVHAGVGCVVGYTQTVTDAIVPNLVGVDVACGMLVCKVSQDYNFNYVDVQNKIIRKGSISLQAGERAIIPMNMRDGSLIVTGKATPRRTSPARTAPDES